MSEQEMIARLRKGTVTWAELKQAADLIESLREASRTPEGMLEDDRFKAAIRAHERFNGTPARDFDAEPLQESERRYWRPIRAAICPILPSGAE